jgi:hypothetical protein
MHRQQRPAEHTPCDFKKTMTVAQLAEECGCNSAGQVYRHLKLLVAADWVTEDSANESKGVFSFISDMERLCFSAGEIIYYLFLQLA